MADNALNYFVSSGTAAEMALHTPDPPTPAAGPDYGVRWFQTDTGNTYEWDGAVWVLASGTGTGTVTNTGTLTDHAVIVGNGTVDVSALASLGTTTTVLHGNAAGDPTFGAVSLTADISGTLGVTNGGTGITSFGTGIATALGVNVGSAGAPVVNGGALGTPASGTLTNCTGLPVAGGGTGASTLTGVLKGNGTSAFTAATVGTDYVAPGGIGAVKIVLKTGDESLTSDTTLQNDNELLFAMGTSQTWLVELNLLTISASNSSGNIKLFFTLPASGAVLSWGGLGNLTSAGGSTDMTSVRNYGEVGAVTATAWVVNTIVMPLYMFALVTTAGTAGNFTLQWAQNSSSGNATTIKAGSYLKAMRVA